MYNRFFLLLPYALYERSSQDFHAENGVNGMDISFDYYKIFYEVANLRKIFPWPERNICV